MVQALDDIARGVLEGLAKRLQLRADAFLPILDRKAVDTSKQSASSLEAIHYMQPGGAAADPGAPACAAHEDKGLLTLVYSDTEEGLHMRLSWKLAIVEGYHIIPDWTLLHEHDVTV